MGTLNRTARAVLAGPERPAGRTSPASFPSLACVLLLIPALIRASPPSAPPSSPGRVERVVLAARQVGPTIDGSCDDALYEASRAAYLEGTMLRRASLLLSASETQLFLCLPNLPREIARIRVSLGSDHEATTIALSHYRLVAARNGTLLLQQGMLEEGRPTAESVRVVAASDGSDSRRIELAIDLTYLGGRARLGALRVALEKDNGAIVASWPRNSHASNPSTWTVLEVGSQPLLEARSAGALSVDGYGGYLVIPYAPELSPPEYTIEAWVRARNHSCGTVFGSVSPDAPWLGICDTVQFHARGGATRQG